MKANAVNENTTARQASGSFPVNACSGHGAVGRHSWSRKVGLATSVRRTRDVVLGMVE
jgi:hypothetical protein